MNAFDELRWMYIPFWCSRRRMFLWLYPHAAYDMAARWAQHASGPWNNMRKAGPNPLSEAPFEEFFLPLEIVMVDGKPRFKLYPIHATDQPLSRRKQNEFVAEVLRLLWIFKKLGWEQANLWEALIAYDKTLDLLDKAGCPPAPEKVKKRRRRGS